MERRAPRAPDASSMSARRRGHRDAQKKGAGPEAGSRRRLEWRSESEAEDHNEPGVRHHDGLHLAVGAVDAARRLSGKASRRGLPARVAAGRQRGAIRQNESLPKARPRSGGLAIPRRSFRAPLRRRPATGARGAPSLRRACCRGGKAARPCGRTGSRPA